MANKNEKTFADLFSSSTPESDSKEVENKSENVGGLNSLFEKSNISFDKVENEDVNTKPLGLNSLLFDINENSSSKNKNEDLISEQNEVVSQKDDGLSFDTLSSSVTSELESKENSNLNSESVKNIESSSFKKESVLEDLIKGNSIGSENPFLENENILEDKELVVEENLLENSFGQSDGALNERKENSSNKEENSLENPFLENFSSVVDEGNELTKEENPFFQKEDSIATNASIFEGENIFRDVNHNESVALGSSDAISESLSSEENNINDFWETSKDSKDAEVKEEPKSVSPFFEEEVKNEENPLFLEKINLIENEVTSKKVGIISTKNSKHFDVKVVKKKEPFIKFLVGVISYALFIWLLLIGVALLVYVLDIKIRAAKGDYSSPTFNAYVVLTGSMLPDIQVYDVVITKKVDAAKLEEKDVITFASADTRFLNTIITHRIIKKNYDSKTKSYTFQTKGDNNNVADSALVPEDNIYGKVILKIPKLGYLQEFLASDGGWIIVILIPCLTVISYDIVKLTKGLKKKKYKNIKVQK